MPPRPANPNTRLPRTPPRPGRALSSRRRLVAIAVIGTLAGCQAEAPERTSVQIIDSRCDLHRGPCTVDLGAGRALTLALSPRPLPLMQPLQVSARLDGTPPPPMTLDLLGETMDMGINRRPLRPDGRGGLAAVASLPVCTTGAMDWRADVRLDWAAGPQQVRFFFRTP